MESLQRQLKKLQEAQQTVIQLQQNIHSPAHVKEILVQKVDQISTNVDTILQRVESAKFDRPQIELQSDTNAAEKPQSRSKEEFKSQLQ